MNIFNEKRKRGALYPHFNKRPLFTSSFHFLSDFVHVFFLCILCILCSIRPHQDPLRVYRFEAEVYRTTNPAAGSCDGEGRKDEELYKRIKEDVEHWVNYSLGWTIICNFLY